MSQDSPDPHKSGLKRWLTFGCVVVLYLLFMNVFTPFWVSHSKLHQDFMTAVDDLDVPVGAMYYNDLPFINEAAMMLYDTWRYLPRDMNDKKMHSGNNIIDK